MGVGIWPSLVGSGALVVIVGWLVVHVIVAVWLGRDAVDRRVPEPWAWCLGAAIGSVPVWLVYLFVREDMVRSRGG